MMSFYYVVLPIIFAIIALLFIFLLLRRCLILRKRALPLWRRIITYGFYVSAIFLLGFAYHHFYLQRSGRFGFPYAQSSSGRALSGFSARAAMN